MSSVTLILGIPGAGKTSLMTCILKSIYKTQGRRLLQKCNDVITRLNKNRKTLFEFPTQPPIYTDVTSFKVKFKVGYEDWFEPYIINPYYLGVGKKKKDVQFLLPYGQVFIPEMQKYTDSRQGQTFPKKLKRLFEIRRHFNLDIYMDGHRGQFIDKKVREMCDRIIEIQSQEHETDVLGRITKTVWYVREFDGYDAYEAYLDSKQKLENYTEKTYAYNGNIFKIYDSFGCEDEFVPSEGEQFSMLKPLKPEEVVKLPKEVAKFYDVEEPKGYRTAA